MHWTNTDNKGTKDVNALLIPCNDPSEEARPHSPKLRRMLSLIAFETLCWLRIMGSSFEISLFGSTDTSITMYLFLNPTMMISQLLKPTKSNPV